ncbi:MAG TPA: ABC transporter permease, partial [Puia sp.]
MIRKQLLFALRRLSRHKLTTTINILGLTLGVLSCLVIFLYVDYEFSYDRFHPDRDRIYRVVVSLTSPNGTHNDMASVPPPLAADLRRELTGFSSVAGIYTENSRVIVPEGGKPARVFSGVRDGEPQHISFADPQYFDIFHYQWLAGNPATALKSPFSVVLAESEARRYFDRGNPEDWMGRTLVYLDSLTVSVSGIVKDWKQNSDFGFADLISYSSIEHSFLQKDMNGWNMFQFNVNAFVKLSPGTSEAQVEKQLPAFFKRHKQLPVEVKGGLTLQPLKDIHFNSSYEDTYGRRAHKPTLYALAGIALFILVIAAINFVNLSTAQAVLRAKEVGVRKVLGSSRGGLVRQFLSETGFIVFASMGLALLLANPVIAALHDFIPEGVRLHPGDPGTWLFIVLTVMVTCLLAGWYPARALSSFLPAISLRGKGSQQLNSKSFLRKGLIVFQFTVSLLFIIGTMMVGRQIHYMINTDLGFKKDAIVTIRLPWDQPGNLKTVLANEISRISGVRQVCLSTATPEAEGHGGTYLEYKGAADIRIDAGCDRIDSSYMSLYGLTLVAGRNFYATDTARQGSDPATAGGGPVVSPFRAFILNETAAKALGFRRPADAVGHEVSSGFSGTIGPVLGIVKDFHSTSLHDKIQPFFFTTQAEAGGLLSVKLASADQSAATVKGLLHRMQVLFTKTYPKDLFQARFFDET